MTRKQPEWTVLYNIVSPESDGRGWVGTGWEFFDDFREAERCRERLSSAGNVATVRPYHDFTDRQHLGAGHR